MAENFIEYLGYSKIENAKKVIRDGITIVTVPSRYEKQVEKLFKGFQLALEEDKAETGGFKESTGRSICTAGLRRCFS